MAYKPLIFNIVASLKNKYPQSFTKVQTDRFPSNIIPYVMLPMFLFNKTLAACVNMQLRSQGSNVFWIFLALLKLHIEERHFQTTQIQIIPFQLPRSKKTSMFQVLKNRLFQASFLKNQVAL